MIFYKHSKVTKKKFNTTKLFLIAVFQFISIFLFCQENEMGIPFAQNFPPKIYGYENQNYSITEDANGILYVGNLSGVLEYDGYSWRLIPQNGFPQLTLDSKGRVYVGSYNDFGYLNRNKQDINVFVSLINKFPYKNKNIGQVSKIVSQNENILFVAGSNLYLWNGNIIKMLDSSAIAINIFKVNEQIYIAREPGGIYKYLPNGLIKVTDNDFFTNKTILGILPHNNSLLIKTLQDKTFFILNQDATVIPLYSEIDEFLKTNEFTCAIPVAEGFYAIGTKLGGFIVIDKEGKYITGLNEKTGLYNDNVHDLFLDKRNNLWASLNNGICRTEVPSAFTYFNRNNGVLGGISSICRYRGKLYIATSRGAFYLKTNSENNLNINSEKFAPVKNIKTDCNRFFPLKEGLLLSANDGIYIINNDKAKKISDGQLEAIARSKTNSNIIYLGKSNGLFALNYKNGKWNELGKLEKINAKIRTIAEDNNGTLWLGTDYNGVYKVNLSNGWNKLANISTCFESNGLPKNHNWIDVYNSAQGVLFSTQKGVYRYNYKKDMFYIDTVLGLDYSSSKRWVYPITEDNNSNLWLSSGVEGIFDKETAVAYYKGQGKKYLLKSVPFRKIKDYTIESIYPDFNNVVWFGGFDGLIRFDPKYYNNAPIFLKTILRQVIIGHDSIVFCGVSTTNDAITGISDTLIPKFQYRYNHITFNFSAPFFESPEYVFYQYYLENFDKEWSTWEHIHLKEYTNLYEGQYVFHVRAKNIYNNLSKEATYHFIIKPPVWRTWYAVLIYLVLLASFILMLLKWRAYSYAQEKFKLEYLLAERTEELVKQKERAEDLIANILPKDTAEELASKGHATRKKYKMVTVLFSDVQGFTQIAEHMNPEKLLDELDKFFLQFDIVVEKLGIEKIKTIGDAYMCAGGIPQKNRTNPIDVIMSAIEMQQFMKILRKESVNEWDIRIGIHTGPVIAGVVGSKKFSYDIWGDTVNIASRMESSGKAGEINISEVTHELVKDFFDCEYRGKLPVKYKGEIDMYFVKGIKPELSVNSEGIMPNEEFFKKLQFIRFTDLEETLMNKLDKGLPQNLYYHNIKHTIDVMVQVEIFGLGENVSRDELLLLKTAALFHDSGFLIGYEDHELLSIKIAKDILPQYQYTDQQIKTISEMIFATKFPPSPRTKLEKILCDADLDYLGRADFIPVSQSLFRELYERGKIHSIDEWNKLQYEFIRNHQYYTETARELRNSKKSTKLDELNNLE